MKKKIVIVLNILMVLFLVIGLVIMVMHNGTEKELVASKGLENLKFYTVLSNIFCGGVGGPNEIDGNSKLQEAYELGKNV